MDEERNHREWTEAEQRSSPSGAVIYRAVLKEGRDELERPSSALFWSGLAAGLSMGASLIAEGLLRAHLPEANWRELVSKLGYSVGFLIVILGRQQLFTENTLTPILPLLRDRTMQTLGHVLRLWAVVLLANLLGCVAAAWVAGKTVAFEADVRTQFLEIGRHAMEGSFAAHVLKGILAGWLIALMVWLLPFAETARVWVIIILSYLVGLGHFSHIIAGAVQVLYLGVVGNTSWGQVIGNYLVPTLIGNILGGVALVAAINHAQVVSGAKGQDF